jgi:hypothetical protein
VPATAPPATEQRAQPVVVSRSATICEIDTFMTLLSSTITNCADARIAMGSPSPVRASSGRALSPLVVWLAQVASAFTLSCSNSSWVIAPESSSSLALAISAADPPAASRTYWSNSCF